MDLREFVRVSLVDIVTGVHEAQGAITDLGGSLDPGMGTTPKDATYVRNKSEQFVTVQQVEFDVAVTASHVEGKEAKAGIEVVGLSLGSG
jgi:hypothetical protein